MEGPELIGTRCPGPEDDQLARVEARSLLRREVVPVAPPMRREEDVPAPLEDAGQLSDPLSLQLEREVREDREHADEVERAVVVDEGRPGRVHGEVSEREVLTTPLDELL